MDIDILRKTAFLNEKWLSGKPRSIVVWLHGLGYAENRTEIRTNELAWSQQGALVILPWYGPWSWMNRQARAMVDEMIDCAKKHYGLENAPLIANGGSMGGCSALIFCRYSRHKVRACAAAAPPCDLLACYRDPNRQDVPRTMHQAFYGYGEPWEDVLREHSPLYQVPGMPDIPYLIIQGNEDVAVPKKDNADPFVAAMKKAGRNVEYIEIPNMGHSGEAMPIKVINRHIEFVSSFLA